MSRRDRSIDDPNTYGRVCIGGNGSCFNLLSDVEPVPARRSSSAEKRTASPPLTGSGGVSSPKMAVELRVLDQNVVLRVLCVPINVAMSIYTCGDQGAVPRIATLLGNACRSA